MLCSLSTWHIRALPRVNLASSSLAPCRELIMKSLALVCAIVIVSNYNAAADFYENYYDVLLPRTERNIGIWSKIFSSALSVMTVRD